MNGGGLDVAVAVFRFGEVVLDANGAEADESFGGDEDGVGAEGEVVVVEVCVGRRVLLKKR
jgi:hypothetical protein